MMQLAQETQCSNWEPNPSVDQGNFSQSWLLQSFKTKYKDKPKFAGIDAGYLGHVGDPLHLR